MPIPDSFDLPMLAREYIDFRSSGVDSSFVPTDLNDPRVCSATVVTTTINFVDIVGRKVGFKGEEAKSCIWSTI